MADFYEQKYAIKFFVKLGKSATDTYSDLKKAFGIDAMSERTCVRWHKDFKNGRESCELEGGPGDPVSALTEETINNGGTKKELKGRRFLTATAAIKTLESILKVMSKEGFEHVFKE
ncbi:hypothetical protein J6590_030258 [Homalodisca vitripennis]|nr:hypothetical protein J6590_030258 [Homalodisca vitripennis]